MFTHSKVAQMAAVFAENEGGAINVLKLAKLLYLSDREAMNLYGMPISFDNLASMPHGPVLSQALNMADGKVFGRGRVAWAHWIMRRIGNDVSIARKFSRAELTELSDADLEVIDSVWKKFGRMDQFQLRDYTHHHCPEWKNPGSSSRPIAESDVFLALGRSQSEAASMAEAIAAERKLDKIFARLA